MNKKCIKMIMELIFIFILPLGIILASISCEKAMTYDENGNQLTEEKHIEYNNVILNEGTGDYISKLKINQRISNNTPQWQNLNNWYSSSGTAISNNGTFLYITVYSLDRTSYKKYTTADRFIANHKYLLNVYHQFTNGVIVKTDSLNDLVLTNSAGTTIQDYLFYEVNGNYTNYKIYFWKNTTDNSTTSLRIFGIELIDLTEMFGSGYEPTTIQEYNTYVNNQMLNYSRNGETIEYIGSSQISENAEPDLTIWGKIKNLIIDNLQLTDNIIVDIILSYTIIWFIMFIIWHFFYLFFDGITHLFIDWADRNKR